MISYEARVSLLFCLMQGTKLRADHTFDEPEPVPEDRVGHCLGLNIQKLMGRPARVKKPRMMNFSAFWSCQSRIEGGEISQASEVDHQHPQRDPLFKPNLNHNPSRNPNAHYPNHSSTLRLHHKNPNQLQWISIPLLV